MNSNDFLYSLHELKSRVQAHEWDQARCLARTITNHLLKIRYAQIRGQASAAIMRGLLELEIEIGGENGNFRDFDIDKMIDLFVRGDVTGYMEIPMASGPALSTAVDCKVVVDWLDADANDSESPRSVSMQFICAWLMLLAEESGILESDEEGAAQYRVLSRSTPMTAAKLPNGGKPYTETTTGMTFVFVPGGTFSMGDTFEAGMEDEKPVHEVRLSDYYLATCPVTQAQWKCLMRENPSNFVGDDHPVEQVTLPDVQAFVEKLNAASASTSQFSLPTETQWEYAARSGGKDQLYAGGQDAKAVAWFQDDNIAGTAPVSHKKPNDLGIYDMSGNVWEWCLDVYHPQAYQHHNMFDPVCTNGSKDRVIRGGSWHLDAWSTRCSRRFRFDPVLFGPALGFRVVINLP